MRIPAATNGSKVATRRTRRGWQMGCRRNYFAQCAEPDSATDRYRKSRIRPFPLVLRRQSSRRPSQPEAHVLSSLPVQATAHPQAKLHVPDLHDRLRASRQLSLALAAPLSDEDQTVQPMDDASPTKWHLAHTTWFYESFILKPNLPDYREFSADFEYCFNSYYESKGERQPRGLRGLLTRPSAAQVRAYRAHVDEALTRLFTQGFVDEGPDPLAVLIELGINHEQQHQELLLTDILSLFAANPLRPAYRDPAPRAEPVAAAADAEFIAFEGGIRAIGYDGAGFSYDNEGPRHEVLLYPYRLANRCVTNGEWLAFMEAGGYGEPLVWLADGWATVKAQGWRAPGYWEQRDGVWHQMTLEGLLPVDPRAPVTHVSYFEANAYRQLGRQAPAHRVRVGGGKRRLSRRRQRSHHQCPAPAPGDGCRRRPPGADVRRRVGVDVERLPALSRLSPGARRRRRIQRQVHGQPERAARRLLRDRAGPRPRHLSQLLLPASALAVHRPAPRRGCRMNIEIARSAIPADTRREVVPEARDDFADALIDGLSARQKSIPCRFFYDAAGSALFEAITELPEYYPTRTETAILRDHAADMAALAAPGAVLIEFGSGSSTKTELLLAGMPDLHAYMPIDISGAALQRGAGAHCSALSPAGGAAGRGRFLAAADAQRQHRRAPAPRLLPRLDHRQPDRGRGGRAARQHAGPSSATGPS